MFSVQLRTETFFFRTLSKRRYFRGSIRREKIELLLSLLFWGSRYFMLGEWARYFRNPTVSAKGR